MISISNLSKVYTKGGDVRIPAIEDVNLTIEDGESIAVLGTSGSGKSSLLHILGGLDSEYTGEVNVKGEDIADWNLTEYRRFCVGTIFQQFYLIPTFTVLQNVLMPYRLSHPFRMGGGKEKAKDLLNQVGLSDRLNHTPDELSGGQLQRVAIARALINEPHILLADEPTGNLDTRTGGEVLDLLFQLNQDQNVTLIIVSHDTEVKNFVQRAVRLQDGQLVTEDV